MQVAPSAKIHLLGASGSGTTTLGRALASRLGCVQFDTDDYYWLPTDPPFQSVRERSARQALLGRDLALTGPWVSSGSLCGWGDIFIPRFDLVVFMRLPPAVRLARLAERERQRYGDEAIAVGGRLHQAHIAFMAWAAAYDDGGLEMRSLRLHEQWLTELPCPVLRLTDDRPIEAHLDAVLGRVGELDAL